MTPSITKTSKQIAIELKEKEREFEEFINGSRRTLELENRRNYDTKKQHILKAGKTLQRLHLVPTDRISTRLQREYRGLVAPQTIRGIIMREGLQWTLKKKGRAKNKGARQLLSFDKVVNMSSKQTAEEEDEPLTAEEEAHLEEARKQSITDRKIEEIIQLWTGKDHAAQGEIISRTPVGKHWAQELAEESIDYMRTTALRMTKSDLIARLNDLRAFEYIRAALSTVVYEVYEQRKKTEPLGQA